MSVPRATSEPQGKREKRTKTDEKDSCQIHSLSFILLFVFFDTNLIHKSEEERWGVTTLTPHLTPFSRRYARRRGAAKVIQYSIFVKNHHLGCAKGFSKDNFFSMNDVGGYS